MDMIVRGEPHELDFVRRICRDKVRRGVIAILPATHPASDDVVVKLRNERDETVKENEKLRERVAELEGQLANVESLADNVESVPETSDTMDNKYLDDEIEEVDIDADSKALSEADSKDLAAEDVKETVSARKSQKSK